MGGPCATGSSVTAEISATGSGAMTTGSLTDSKAASVCATGSGAGVSNTGVAGSKATGVQAGSGVSGAQTISGSGAIASVTAGSLMTGSIQTGVSAKTASSCEAGGISARLSMIAGAASSITGGSPTELNSAISVAGAETGWVSAITGFSGSGTMSAIRWMT